MIQKEGLMRQHGATGSEEYSAGIGKSTATRRAEQLWMSTGGDNNGFATGFQYSTITGIGKEAGITRRDPTTVLKLGATYYVWYTRRKTDHDRDLSNRPPVTEQSWDVPVFDWDLSEIWYATSTDGFHWQEHGVAVGTGPRDAFDGRSVFTPDVLVWEDRYYLYYQAVAYPYTVRSRNVVGMSWSESPDGPWHRFPQPVLAPGEPGEWLGDDDSNNVGRYGEWDSHKVHDPFAMIREGKVWLYYKGQPMGWGTAHCRGIGWGVATADRPEGPFQKSALNPVTNSGHETLLFPYKEGVVAICNHDGPEKDTVQFASDGLNFVVKAHVMLPPPAGGPFASDSYSDSGDGQGITWGLAHMSTEELQTGNSYIMRFDCDLSRQVDRPGYGPTPLRLSEDVYFSHDFLYSDDLGDQHVNASTLHGQEPIKPSEERPKRRISAAMERVWDRYGIYKDEQSEFFSAFKYARLTGIGAEANVSRLNPSKVVKVGGTYYVWYTKKLDDEPTSTIWFATSLDGLRWDEQSCAVSMHTYGSEGCASVAAPDILKYNGRWHLYYEVNAAQNRGTPHSTLRMSWADAPGGPWQPSVEVTLTTTNGESDWETGHARQPFVLVRDGQIWMYYRGSDESQFGDSAGWGVAFASSPRGPFHSSPFNPVTNSGQEPFLYPYRDGLVAITGFAGPERNTVQYSSDGHNFEIVGKVSLPPSGAGPFIADAFDDDGDGRGITWGLAHILQSDEGPASGYLVRFECDLSRDLSRAGFFRRWNFRFPESAYLSGASSMTESMKTEAVELMRSIDQETRIDPT